MGGGGGGVVVSVSLHPPDKGFWACQWNLLPDMPRQPGTCILLCNLMLKPYGFFSQLRYPQFG